MRSLHLKLQQGRHSTADICWKKGKKKEQKITKKEKVRTALVSWIPKRVLSLQNSNVVYSTKLQQKLLHSTTLVALGRFQIHSIGQELLRRRPIVNPGSFNTASVALYQPELQLDLQQPPWGWLHGLSALAMKPALSLALHTSLDLSLIHI